MRLFLLLAFAFALISIALVVSQHPSFVERTRQFIGSDTPGDVRVSNSSDAWISQFENTTTIGMQDDNWQALSGFPSFAKLNFPLPRNADLIDGRLRLQLHSQLAQGGVGSLRVTVNDERRGEVVLNPGQEQKTLLLGLTPEDLSRPTVTVSLSAHGDIFQGACPSRPARGAIIDVLSGSGVQLAHLAPLADTLDIWLAQARTPQIPLDRTSHGKGLADALLLAARLRQSGIRTNFVTVSDAEQSNVAGEPIESPSMFVVNREQGMAFAFEPGEKLFSVRDPNTAGALLTGTSPVRVSDLIPGSDSFEKSNENAEITETNAQNFFRSNRWRVEYNLVDQDGGQAPARLNLALKLAEQQLDEGWLINVRFNNSLLSSERIESEVGTFTKAVLLPGALTQVENEITIDLATTQDSGVGCDPGPELTAQLLPESKLEGTAFLGLNVPAYLIETLAQSRGVNFTAEHALTPIQAASAADLLAHILPKEVAVQVAVGEISEVVKIEVVTKTALEERLKTLQLADATKNFWLVNQDTTSGAGKTTFKIIPLLPEHVASETLSMLENAVFLLIEA